MFKRYLRIQSPAIQLVIMLAFWSLLFLLAQFAATFYFRVSWGITSDKLAAFLENGIYQHPNALFVSQALFQVVAFLFPALIYAYLADPAPGAYLGIRKPGKPIQVLLSVFIAFCLIFFVAPLGTWLKELNLGSASRELDEQRGKFINAYLSGGNLLTVFKNVLLIAVVPAICEEFFFRGLAMKFAYSFVPKWWFAIGVSAAFFAAFHSSISEFVPIFIAGIILGWVYYLTSSIWLNVLLHLIVNAVQALAGIYSNPALDKSLEDGRTILTLFVIATVLIIAALYLMFKNRTPLPRSWSVYMPEEREA